MTIKNLAPHAAISAICFLFLSGCTGDVGDTVVPDGSLSPGSEEPASWSPNGEDGECQPDANLRALINGIEPAELPTPKDLTLTDETTQDEVQGDTVMECVYKRYEGVKLYETLVSFDPNADSLWPGAVIQTKTLPQGLLAPIGLPRAPGTITVTNATLSSESDSLSRTIEEPTQAAVQDAIDDVLRSENLSFAAKSTYDARQVYSLNEAAVKAGVAVEWMSGSVKASFDGEWGSSKTSYIVKFTQNYYTVTFSPPQSPESVFDPCVATGDALPYMGSDNAPGYLASVTYGRMLLMKIESNDSSSDIEAALNAAFNASAVDVEVDIDTQFKEVLRNAVVTVFALGGNPESAVELMTDADNRAEKLANYLENGAKYSPESPGVPISYTVRTLADNATVKVASTLDYQVPYCSAASDHLMLELDSINVVNDGDNWPKGAGEISVRVYGKLTSQDAADLGSQSAGACTASTPDNCGELLLDAYYHADSGDLVTIQESAFHSFLANRTSGEQLVLTLWADEDDNDAAVLATNTHEFLLEGDSGFWRGFGEGYMEDAADNLQIGLNYRLNVLETEEDEQDVGEPTDPN